MYSERDEVSGEWRNLYSEELHNVYKENEVGGACGTHGRREKSVQDFGGKARRTQTTSKDRCIDGRMGSQWNLGRLAGGVEWIQLAQDRDQWRALVNAVMNLGFLAPRS
jgi:hypothetical protein